MAEVSAAGSGQDRDGFCPGTPASRILPPTIYTVWSFEPPSALGVDRDILMKAKAYIFHLEIN
jgi:hypothetical protein